MTTKAPPPPCRGEESRAPTFPLSTRASASSSLLQRNSWRLALGALLVLAGCNAGNSSPTSGASNSGGAARTAHSPSGIGPSGSSIIAPPTGGPGSGIQDAGTIGNPDGGVYLAHEIVVKRAFSVSESAFNAAIINLGGRRIASGDLLSTELGYERISLPETVSPDGAIKILMANGVAESAERNYVVNVEATTNDPSLGSLWGLSKSKTREAWDLSTGSSQVLVGITDTGIDPTHVDLAANLYKNPGEIPGNGIDDDGNGFVDDVSGWNFVNANNVVNDLNGHGTHVAGTIGAVGNNGIGVAGVNWKVSILPIKVCGQSSCSTTDVVNGFLYAARMGVRVVNTSLGGYYPPIAYERDAIARLASKGALIVIAAGNSASNNDTRPSYPASYDLDNIVSVAATTSSDGLASFSNYGVAKVHIGAPGTSILSTWPGNQYNTLQGTSMASPHVAGAAALLLAHKPALTYSGVRTSLLESATRIPALSGRVSSGGRLDVFNLLSMEDPCDPTQCSPNATCATVSGASRCQCKPGYEGDGKTCTDVNECAWYPVPCSANGTCTNTAGSYTCSCKPGFVGNGVICSDVNECATGAFTCDTNASCVNKPGGYDCTCKAGFEGSGKVCTDVDECATGRSNCDVNATCSNTAGGFTCACKSGYAGDGTTCTDIDECKANASVCDGNADCKNREGAFECACRPGFEARGQECIDVDECTLGTYQCNPGATCVNVPGSYACECPAGASCPGRDLCQPGLESCDRNATCTNRGGSYSCRCNPGYAGDGFFCFDVNECTPSLSDCDVNAVCSNSTGGHACTCKSGYQGDGKTCSDVDECGTGTARCDAHASCSNTPGGYTCTCGAGFEGNGTTCTDVDECAKNLDNCGNNAICTNTPGSFSCACKPGYVGDGHVCNDVNECAAPTSPCSAQATCANTPGGYTCTCRTGYEGDGKTCTDIDECAAGTHQCAPVGGVCTNTAGSYTCQCGPGFTGNGRTCTDVDECSQDPKRCGAKSVCLNTPGSFACACTLGYEWNGSECVDVDECATGTNRCSPDATCTNTNGNYKCTCKPGFEGGGFTCEDVDECGNGWQNCGEGASCKNTHGSSVCVCKPGFKGNGGGKCDDADECADGTHTCNANAQCTNTVGGYTCACKAGYTGDGFQCADSNECNDVPSPCDVNARCDNTPGGHTCTCGAGLTGDGTKCVDIDECANGTAVCSPNARCTNKFASYECACNKGYSGDGKTCTDVDECANGASGCDTNATCTNSAGSYQCVCRAGFKGDGVTCTPPGDVDECQNGTATCSSNADCHNTTGSYRCDCKPGFEGDGRTCVDIDECARGTAGCDTNATCTNSPGNFSCQCKAGYSGDGKSCVAPDPCAAGVAQCDARASCRASAGGGYTCVCPKGFQGDGKTCSDIDECSTGAATCDANATCINTDGGYTCACKAGYTGDGRTCGRDECALGIAQCDANAKCIDTAQGYTCQCKPGYQGNGTTCTDVNECAAGTHACSTNGICTNTTGGYTCACKSGFEGTGFTCAAKPILIRSVDTRGDHTCAVLDNGTVRCWGRNDSGQLGYAHTQTVGDDEPATAVVDVGDSVRQISVGVAHSCALLDGGRVRCWGRNVYGQLGYGHTRNIGDDEAPRTAGDVNLGGVAVQIAAGGEHTCALLDNGAVKCWGLGSDGRLGYGNVTNVGDDEPPSAVGAVDVGGVATEIAAGRDHTCARLSNGAVRCWGRGTWGQLGYGNVVSVGDNEMPASAGDVALGGKAVQISAGWYHTCAVLDTHAVRCWGYGFVGQLGHANTDAIGDDETPAVAGDIKVGGVVIQVAAGLYHTCAVLDTGAVRCWGYGLDGRLGYAAITNVGDDESPSAAGDVNVGGKSIQVATGFAHTCAVLQSGAVRCWGSGALGRLGTGKTVDIGDDETPAQGSSVVVSGSIDECALGIDDCDVNAHCNDEAAGFSCTCESGYSGDGRHCADLDECAAGTATCSPDATCTNTVGNYTCACKSGYTGNGFTCSDIDECASGRAGCDAHANCTNRPGSYLCTCQSGYEGDGVTCRLRPTIVTVAAGGSHSCALLNTGEVRCWGAANFGQLGYGNTNNIGDDEAPYVAGAVDLGGKAVEIAAGENHTCARMEDSTVRCWGRASAGQLGYGNRNDIGDNEAPRTAGIVDVGGSVVHIAAGQQHTCAVLHTGSVRCWGLGDTGRLGYANTRTIGDDETPASAGDVALGGKASRLALGQYHSCALLESGAVRCWGFGLYGQLGYAQSTTIGDDETPASAGSVNLGGAAVQIAAGAHHTCALMQTGNARCWGYGIYGSLGYGNTDTVGNDETPASAGDVPVGGKVINLAAGGYRTCALLQTGAVRCWGYGSHGALGYASTETIGDNETPSSSGDVPLGATASFVACGATHACSVSADGIRCWGDGTLGRLGYASVADVGDNETPASVGVVRVLQ